SACDDGDACTENDTCTDNVCAGTAPDCDDNIACTVDACDGGDCSHTPSDALCDDGNPNTTDVCDPQNGDPETGCVNTSTSGPQLLSAVSRRTHGAAGAFDVAMDLGSSATTVEPRSGTTGSPQAVITFDSPVEATDGTPDCSEVSITNGTC